ncbi:unnamed protein product [Closterium sp. NIES-54]
MNHFPPSPLLLPFPLRPRLSPFPSPFPTPPSPVGGEWRGSERRAVVVDPLNGKDMISVPDAQAHEIQPFVESLSSCPKSGLHNPFKNPSRYLLYGSVSAAAANALKKPEVSDFFARLIQRVSPKSLFQARAEVSVTQKFLENFSGDQVGGRAKVGGRWVGGEQRGSKKSHTKSLFQAQAEVSVTQKFLEKFSGDQVGCGRSGCLHQRRSNDPLNWPIPLTHLCLLFPTVPLSCDLLPATRGMGVRSGRLCLQRLLRRYVVPAATFETLCLQRLLRRLCLQRSVRSAPPIQQSQSLPPFYPFLLFYPPSVCLLHQLDYVAWVCDQDAYACSGQKCSAQSILFMHKNWVQAGLMDRLRSLAARRNLQDLTIGPVLTVSAYNL